MRLLAARPNTRLAAALPLIAIQAGLLLFVLFLSSREIKDADLFFHLRTGADILHSHHVPHTDPYSRAGPEHGALDIAYSWLFEIALASLHAALGWAGIKLFIALLGGLTALLLMAEVYARHKTLWATAFLAIALLGLSPVLTPRPWLFSALFTLIELKILFSFQDSGRPRALLGLLPLYVLWANLHIQFVIGLVFIGVFAIANILERRARTSVILAAAAVLCAAATLINPYGFRVWSTIAQYASQSKALTQIQDASPPHFGNLPEVAAVLVFAIAAYTVLRAANRRVLLSLCLLTGLYFFLHSRRDIWLSILTSGLVFAQAARPTAKDTPTLPPYSWAIVPISILFFFAAGFGKSLNNSAEQKQLEGRYPFAAVAFVRSHLKPEGSLRGALYNSFDWGSFLIWALPEIQVSMDGRINVHGEARTLRHWATWDGTSGWRNDTDLGSANLVILERRAPLSAALARESLFAKVYEDSQAVVFSRR